MLEKETFENLFAKSVKEEGEKGFRRDAFVDNRLAGLILEQNSLTQNSLTSFF